MKCFEKLKVLSFMIFRGVEVVKVEFHVQALVDISVVRIFTVGCIYSERKRTRKQKMSLVIVVI